MAPAEADVRIESGHPVYGNRPWTQQTRDCGQLGDYISIGSSFFTEDSALGGRGHLMMRQWARYLFGIFDDTSCLNDTSVPSEFCSSPSRDVDDKHAKVVCTALPYPRVVIDRHLKSAQVIALRQPTFHYKVVTWPDIDIVIDEPIEECFGRVTPPCDAVRMASRTTLDDTVSKLALDESIDGKFIIFVTSGPDSSELKEMTNFALLHKTSVSVVAVGLKSDDERFWLIHTTDKTRGKFVDVPSQVNQLATQVELEDAFVSVLNFHGGRSLADDLPVTTWFRQFDGQANSHDFLVKSEDRDTILRLYRDPNGEGV